MAKDEPVAPPPLTEQQLKIAVNDVGRSPTTMKRFIAQQLMTFAAENNGEIDITNKQVTDGIATLMTAVQTKSQKDRGIGVLSIAQTEVDMTKDIQNAIARGADPQLFEPAKASLLSVKSELADKVKSNKGVASLIGEFIKDQSLANGIPFMNAETGRGLVPQEKAELVAKLMPYVQFPDNVSPFVRKDIAFVPKVVSPKAQARMAEFFSVEGKLTEFGSCTLDPNKLTPENMKKFGDALSKDLEIMAVVEQGKKEVEGKATSIIEASLKELENKGHTILPGTRTKMYAELMPVLTSLGSQYLEANKVDLSKGLTTSLDSGKTFSFRFKKNFDIAENNLHSVATKITADHFKKSDEAAVKKYQSAFSNIDMSLARNTVL
ncbi:MAG: hypothetical protein K9G65_00395 [Rickettsiaceae bacterium]|nr:hypothetical protein [Rickettsiaceae bacterium]